MNFEVSAGPRQWWGGGTSMFHPARRPPQVSENGGAHLLAVKLDPGSTQAREEFCDSGSIASVQFAAHPLPEQVVETHKGALCKQELYWAALTGMNPELSCQRSAHRGRYVTQVRPFSPSSRAAWSISCADAKTAMADRSPPAPMNLAPVAPSARSSSHRALSLGA